MHYIFSLNTIFVFNLYNNIFQRDLNLVSINSFKT